MQRAKKLALDLCDAVRIEFEVVPRLSVGNHVPTGRVGTVLTQRLERIYGVAQSLGHLLAVLIEDQAIADNVFVRYGIEDHRSNRVQRVEPAAGLVHTLRNEVGRVRLTRVDFFFVFKRVMPLGVRHGTAIKPNVNQICLAPHRASIGSLECDAVDDVLVQVELLVVGLGHVPRHKGFQGVSIHESGLYGLRTGCFQLLY